MLASDTFRYYLIFTDLDFLMSRVIVHFLFHYFPLIEEVKQFKSLIFNIKIPVFCQKII